MSTVYLVYASNHKLVPHFPDSALCLAGVLLQRGHRVEVIDLTLDRRPAAELRDPLLLGLTAYSNENLRAALELAADFRDRYPGVPIVWGGPHAQMVPEETARHPLVDAACYGEGEQTIVRLVDQLASASWDPAHIPGLVYRDGDEVRRTEPAELVELDQLPFPPYQLIDRRRYPLAREKAYYQSSRGCPFSCTFCSQVRRWRSKSAARVLDDLARIRAELEVAEVYFSDANFFVDRRRVRRICEGLLQQSSSLRWTAFCRVDTLRRMDDEMLRLIRASGCRQLDIGGESGSDRVLAALSKGTTRQMILEAVARLTRVDIRPELSFITGLPMETAQDAAQTLSLIDAIYADYPDATVNGMFHYQPYPDSPLGAEVIQRFDLPIPRSLEQWSEHPVTQARPELFPWLDRRGYQRMMLASTVVSYRYFYRRLLESSEGDALARRPGFRVLRALAQIAHGALMRRSMRWRLDRGWDRLPLEWWAFRMVRNRLLQTI